jgi:hypothetical protein
MAASAMTSARNRHHPTAYARGKVRTVASTAASISASVGGAGSPRLARRKPPGPRSIWITFQFAIDLPIAQNGALQRAKALEQVRDICHQLAMDFATAGHLRGQ